MQDELATFREKNNAAARAPMHGLKVCSQNGFSHLPLGNGNTLVCWQHPVPDLAGHRIFIQLLDSRGSPAGPPAVVNEGVTATSPWVSVTAISDGGFVLYWQESQSAGRAWGRAYGPDAQPLGEVREFAGGEG